MPVIQGVPDHLEVTALRVPEVGERYYFLGQITEASHALVFPQFIVEPNNDYGVFDLAAIPLPEGWTADGEILSDAFRVPQYGEMYVAITEDGMINTDDEGLVEPVRYFAGDAYEFLFLENSDHRRLIIKQVVKKAAPKKKAKKKTVKKVVRKKRK